MKTCAPGLRATPMKSCARILPVRQAKLERDLPTGRVPHVVWRQD